MGLVRRADILNAISDLFEREAVGNTLDFGRVCDVINRVVDAPYVHRGVYEQVVWERDVAMSQLEDHGIPFGGIAPDVVKVTRCKDCVHDDSISCLLCYIEKQTLTFVNHDPEFYCQCSELKD